MGHINGVYYPDNGDAPSVYNAGFRDNASLLSTRGDMFKSTYDVNGTGVVDKANTTVYNTSGFTIDENSLTTINGENDGEVIGVYSGDSIITSGVAKLIVKNITGATRILPKGSIVQFDDGNNGRGVVYDDVKDNKIKVGVLLEDSPLIGNNSEVLLDVLIDIKEKKATDVISGGTY